jgi:hypothetical protein
MTSRAIDLISAELQGVELPPPDIARAAGLAGPLNDKIRHAADAALQFEDEPGHYQRLIEAPR